MNEKQYILDYSDEGAWAIDPETNDIYLMVSLDGSLEEMQQGIMDMSFRKIPSQLLALLRQNVV